MCSKAFSLFNNSLSICCVASLNSLFLFASPKEFEDTLEAPLFLGAIYSLVSSFIKSLSWLDLDKPAPLYDKFTS